MRTAEILKWQRDESYRPLRSPPSFCHPLHSLSPLPPCAAVSLSVPPPFAAPPKLSGATAVPSASSKQRLCMPSAARRQLRFQQGPKGLRGKRAFPRRRLGGWCLPPLEVPPPQVRRPRREVRLVEHIPCLRILAAYGDVLHKVEDSMKTGCKKNLPLTSQDYCIIWFDKQIQSNSGTVQSRPSSTNANAPPSYYTAGLYL